MVIRAGFYDELQSPPGEGGDTLKNSKEGHARGGAALSALPLGVAAAARPSAPRSSPSLGHTPMRCRCRCCCCINHLVTLNDLTCFSNALASALFSKWSRTCGGRRQGDRRGKESDTGAARLSTVQYYHALPHTPPPRTGCRMALRYLMSAGLRSPGCSAPAS